ncbi:MAG: [Fe-Fe] hydrogenase large subunit C-terminal domain-containing protein [Hungatella hathewayi]|uniref:[Fe-Fe] hydrogenase large subunit C-terminal domain-containing protein n=1 Tax=Hungatella TaxID=1649459 RepID=UPI001105F8D6|nr:MULTISPECIES: [Fe-Fe] hydrogenase large subunit C-terminal domain-containing protein [Hungatella]MCI7385007.1 4Fe-4S dicluster domain-containing protein [Hungatella sp.]MDY6237240.1 [Fe-Fe] hydrogenase large subunit C-terminal domain-containing protein [Hungatella hathewayi]
MDKFYHSVRLDADLCMGCINCIKRCPTQAIRVRNGKAQINSKFCIDCGECIRVCPHHAKHATYDKPDVLKQYEYTVALPAPSLYSQFNNLDDVNIVLNALLMMGFHDVFEVSAAAELVSEATREYLSENPDRLPAISTACPSVVRLIRVRFPNLIPNLLPLNPPVEVAAILAAEKAMKETGLPREKIGIIFISPCPSKVTYVKSPLGTDHSEVDRVLAIKDVYPQLLSCMKAVGDDPPEIGTSGKIGISWGRSGGEASGLFTEEYLAADGIENVIRVLEDMEDQKFTNLKFVELNACNGGCVGGVLTVENPYVAEVKLKRLRKYMPVARSHIEGNAEELVKWTKEVQYEPVFNLGNTMMESFARLNQVERLCKKLPGLDCGSCGAPTCKSLAEDIVRGEAVESDCVYYLRENLHKLSEEVSILADDIAAGNAEGYEMLKVMTEYIQRISDEMSLLDSRDEKEKDQE